MHSNDDADLSDGVDESCKLKVQISLSITDPDKNTTSTFFNNRDNDVGIKKELNNPLPSSSQDWENNSDVDLNQSVETRDYGTRNNELREEVDVEKTGTFSNQPDVDPSKELAMNVHDTSLAEVPTLIAKKAASAPVPCSYVDREPCITLSWKVPDANVDDGASLKSKYSDNIVSMESKDDTDNLNSGAAIPFCNITRDIIRISYLQDKESRPWFKCCSGVPDVRIVEVNPSGRFIRLRNSSETEDKNLGGHYLLQTVDQSLYAVFQFPQSAPIPAGGEISVWSGSAGGGPCLHSPESHYFFETQPRWVSGPNTTTVLYQPNDEALKYLNNKSASQEQENKQSDSPLRKYSKERSRRELEPEYQRAEKVTSQLSKKLSPRSKPSSQHQFSETQHHEEAEVIFRKKSHSRSKHNSLHRISVDQLSEEVAVSPGEISPTNNSKPSSQHHNSTYNEPSSQHQTVKTDRGPWSNEELTHEADSRDINRHQSSNKVLNKGSTFQSINFNESRRKSAVDQQPTTSEPCESPVIQRTDVLTDDNTPAKPKSAAKSSNNSKLAVEQEVTGIEPSTSPRIQQLGVQSGDNAPTISKSSVTSSKNSKSAVERQQLTISKPSESPVIQEPDVQSENDKLSTKSKSSVKTSKNGFSATKQQPSTSERSKTSVIQESDVSCGNKTPTNTSAKSFARSKSKDKKSKHKQERYHTDSSRAISSELRQAHFEVQKPCKMADCWESKPKCTVDRECESSDSEQSCGCGGSESDNCGGDEVEMKGLCGQQDWSRKIPAVVVHMQSADSCGKKTQPRSECQDCNTSQTIPQCLDEPSNSSRVLGKCSDRNDRSPCGCGHAPSLASCSVDTCMSDEIQEKVRPRSSEMSNDCAPSENTGRKSPTSSQRMEDYPCRKGNKDAEEDYDHCRQYNGRQRSQCGDRSSRIDESSYSAYSSRFGKPNGKCSGDESRKRCGKKSHGNPGDNDYSCGRKDKRRPCSNSPKKKENKRGCASGCNCGASNKSADTCKSCSNGSWFSIRNWFKRSSSNPATGCDKPDRNSCDTVCVKESYRMRSKCACFKSPIRPTVRIPCPPRTGCCDSPDNKCTSRCGPAANVIGHVADLESSGVTELCCSEHGRKNSSRRSDACCRDLCQPPKSKRSCKKSSCHQSDPAHEEMRCCKKCQMPSSCEGYSVATAGVVAAGLTMAAMYITR